MLHPAKGSAGIDLTATRKARMAEAFLAYRLSRPQLCEMMETPADQWEDTFKAYTALDNDAAEHPSTVTIEQAVQELGLKDRLSQLRDDQVWSAQDRALYRVMAHFEQESPASGKEEKAGNPKAFFDVVLTHFPQWDRNGDLSLDIGELDLAMSGGYYGEKAALANDPEAAAALATLMQKERMLASSSPDDGDKLTQLDVITTRSMRDARLDTIANNVALTYEESLERAQSMKEPSSITAQHLEPFTIKQGVAGSCVLLSTTATLDRKTLQGMLGDLGEGSSRIKFADGSEESVRPLTLAERLYHARGGDDETWPAVLEMAVAQRLYTETHGEFESLRGAIDGVSPQAAIKLMTGQDTDQRMLDELTVNQSRDALKELLGYGGAIICGSRPNALGDFISVEDLHNGIVNGHAYSILGYNQETDSVELRNPWRRKEWIHQQSPDDGIFEMPMRDFYSSFRWIAAANGKPATT